MEKKYIEPHDLFSGTGGFPYGFLFHRRFYENDDVLSELAQMKLYYRTVFWNRWFEKKI